MQVVFTDYVETFYRNYGHETHMLNPSYCILLFKTEIKPSKTIKKPHIL